MKLDPRTVFARLAARISSVKRPRRGHLKTVLPAIAECVLESRLLLSASSDDDIADPGDTTGGDTGGSTGDTNAGATGGDTLTNGGDTNTGGTGGDTNTGGTGSNGTPSVTLLATAVAIPNPIAAAKALPLDGVWIQNRVLGAIPLVGDNFPVNKFNLVSHTYIVTTDKTGAVINTFSWGNDFEAANPSHWYANKQNDVDAAEKGMKSLKAVQDGKLTVEDLKNVLTLGTWGTRVGGSDLIPFVNTAYARRLLDADSPSRHDWGAGGVTCKQEANGLIDFAESLQGYFMFDFISMA